MPLTAEARAKGVAAIKRKAAERRAAKEHLSKHGVLEVASVAGVDLTKLPPAARELIIRLQTERDESNAKRSEAEKRAIATAEAQFGTYVEEVPTGDFLEVERPVNPEDENWRNKPGKYKRVGYENRRPILEPIMATVQLPIFAYKLNLAPTAGHATGFSGTYISINGERHFDGEVLRVDIDTLRTIKDMVHRGWEQERLNHGKNENAYRRSNIPAHLR